LVSFTGWCAQADAFHATAMAMNLTCFFNITVGPDGLAMH
jgi:hypothetical protein